jgi:D-alanine-D-alanine ligase
MHLCILYNQDHDLLEDDPGREAREDVARVAGALAAALEAEGHRVDRVGVGKDPFAFVATIKKRVPALVLNLCESVAADSRGEMAIPCMLDLLGVPYTGSGPLALGLSLHKDKAKEVLRARGVRTPEFRAFTRAEDALGSDLPLPAIVKPSREDASAGVDFDSVVRTREELAAAVDRVVTTFRQPAIAERYIEGREIYVPLLGNRPRLHLPLSEIRFGAAFDGRPNIVSYKAKWEASSPECQDSPSVGCSLEPVLETKVVATAIAAFEALDCQDYGRVDLRVAADGEPYVIDVNPNCDLHPQAGFAQAATRAGMDYPGLARRLVEIAFERIHGNPSHLSAGPGATPGPARPNRDVQPDRG